MSVGFQNWEDITFKHYGVHILWHQKYMHLYVLLFNLQKTMHQIYHWSTYQLFHCCMHVCMTRFKVRAGQHWVYRFTDLKWNYYNKCHWCTCVSLLNVILNGSILNTIHYTQEKGVYPLQAKPSIHIACMNTVSFSWNPATMLAQSH